MYRKLAVVLLFVASASAVLGQSATTSFDVNGIKVIFKPTVKEIVSVDLYFRGGVSNYPANRAGIENLTLAATAECGTVKYAKDNFKDKEDAYGISVGGSSGYDFGLISLNCISKYFNEGWDLFSEAVMHPVFDEREVGMLKAKLINGLHQEDSDPDSRIDQMALMNAFPGSPYASIDPSGTEATITKFTRADLQAYYKGLLNKNRVFIVVVGKISKADVIAKIQASFGSLPALPYTPQVYNPTPITGNKVIAENRPLATNYIEGVFNAPDMSSPDYAAFRLAISALNNRLFTEIRTKRNLSYAPNARVRVLKMPFALVYVSTTDPNTSVEVMTAEINKLKSTGFSAEEVEGQKSGFITTNYMKEESTSAISSALGLGEIMGSWRLSEELPEKLNSVTVAQMNTAFRKYASGLVWNYLGDKRQADAAASAFALPLK